MIKREARYYQNEARWSVFAYYQEGNRGDILVALPTGTGKAFCIADLITYASNRWQGQRFLMITHSAKLVEQNAETLENLWPFCPIGINCDKLKRRDTTQPIIFGTIGSMAGHAKALGWRDVLIIDEAHMVSPNDSTQYRKLIADLRIINPRMIVIGYTATPYRAGQGMLTEGDDRLFDHIVYDKTGIDDFNRFIDEGFLSKLVPRPMQAHMDMSGVKVVKGEYNSKQANAVANDERMLIPAIEETIYYGNTLNRHCWLIFAQGVEHADRISKLLNDRGIPTASIHSKKSDEDNDRNMQLFYSGRIRAIVNYGVLTTGFDHAPIDMIVMLRATKSASLWVQMLGRGTRPYSCYNPQQYKHGFNYIKYNCLVLDFARNTASLGTINDPKIPKPKGKLGGDVPVKICEAVRLARHGAQGCGAYNHAAAPKCCQCDEEFSFAEKIVQEASTLELVKASEPDPVYNEFNVTDIMYAKHLSKSGTNSLKVTYYCGMQTIEEYVPVEHERGRYIAKKWWKDRASSIQLPKTVAEAYELVPHLKSPVRLTVHMNAASRPDIVKAHFL